MHDATCFTPEKDWKIHEWYQSWKMLLIMNQKWCRQTMTNEYWLIVLHHIYVPWPQLSYIFLHLFISWIESCYAIAPLYSSNFFFPLLPSSRCLSNWQPTYTNPFLFFFFSFPSFDSKIHEVILGLYAFQIDKDMKDICSIKY